MRMHVVFIAVGQIVVAAIMGIVWVSAWRRQLIPSRFWYWSVFFLVLIMIETVAIVALSIIVRN